MNKSTPAIAIYTKHFTQAFHSPLLDDVINFFPPELTKIISDYSLPCLSSNLQKSIFDHLRKEYFLSPSKTNIALALRTDLNSGYDRKYLLIEQHKKLYGPREIVSCMGNDYTKCGNKKCDNWIFGPYGDACSAGCEWNQSW